MFAVNEAEPVMPSAPPPILASEIALALIVREVSGVVPPIVPFTKTSPGPTAKVSAWAPSIALDKVISPDPVPTFKIESAVRVMGAAIERFWLLVVMFAPNETVPAPVWVKAPSMDRSAPILRPPLSITVIGPLSSVVTGARNENAVPVKTMPLAVVVERAPLNVVVPVPAD